MFKGISLVDEGVLEFIWQVGFGTSEKMGAMGVLDKEIKAVQMEYL